MIISKNIEKKISETLPVSNANALKKLRLFQKWFLPALLASEVLLFATLSPYFLTGENLHNIAINSIDLALISAGLTLVIIVGGIDVSTGYAVGLTAWFIANFQILTLNPFLILLISLLVGAVIGLINGYLTAGLSIPSIVATLGTAAIYQTLLFTLWGSEDLFTAPNLNLLSGNSNLGPIPSLVVIVVIIYLLLHLVLTRTKFGRFIFAIGSNLEAARLSGINIKLIRVSVSCILGLLIGLAASTYLARVGVVQASAGNELTLLSIASVVVGGTSILGGEGSILRTLGGMLFIMILSNGIVLSGVPSLWNGLIIGTVILVAVSVNGIVVQLEQRKD
jgi:ribose/xylose/arabinose/galactoside ABC-type transport system permease subunit